MTNKNEEQPRVIFSGEYSYSMERMCQCGHALGEHTAERAKIDGKYFQPCICHELGETLTEPCGCKAFKPAK